MTRLGRAVGPGRFSKVGSLWTLDYRRSDGRRVREALSSDRKVFDRLLVAAGIERVDAQGLELDIHALRHTAASRLLRVGVPLQKVQHVLGHADARMGLCERGSAREEQSSGRAGRRPTCVLRMRSSMRSRRIHQIRGLPRAIPGDRRRQGRLHCRR